MAAVSDPPSLQQAQEDVDAIRLQFLLLLNKFFMMAHSVRAFVQSVFFLFRPFSALVGDTKD
jgi:hypothetical protein